VKNIKNLFNDFFKDKTILITGHTGFIGSWLSIWLNELGAKVIGYALEPYTKNDNYVVSNLDSKITSNINDIRDYSNLQSTFDKYKPDIAYHLASQPLVRLSYDNPKETYDINIGGTVNFFESIRNSDSVKVAINFTSDKCYENKEWIWGYREIDTMGGYDPYSSSKGCSELITTAYRKSFFNPDFVKEHNKSIASVRSGNVIGGGDWCKDRIIPDCIRMLKKNEHIKVRSPKAVRPWQHVLEPLSGLLLLTFKMYDNRGKFSEGWNFGPEETSHYTVEDIVRKIIQYWGRGTWRDVSSDHLLHEAKLLQLDINKARYQLQWNPTLNIDEALKLTIGWYKNKNIDYSFNVDQINQYLEKNKCLNEII
jgi:CDP-glucose 4,6-dehydratase